MIKDIYILGDIDENMTEKVIQQLQTIDEEEIIEKLNIWISTSGGLITECFGIIDYITEYVKIKNITSIKTIGLGGVISCGFFLFLMGNERVLTPHCRVFIHEHITQNANEQTFTERIIQDKSEKELSNMYQEYTATRLGITKTKARSLLRKNQWLKTKDLEKYGIITHVH